ncbi:MAG: CdaR family protein [Oscillospiraceae bacterium]
MDKKNTAPKLWDNKIFWVVFSLLASVLLWVYVTSTEGNIIKQSFEGIPVEFTGSETLREKEGLVVSNVSSSTVSVTLRGTRRELTKLKSSDLKAVIDVSKITTRGNNRVGYDITYPLGVDGNSIDVISRAPQAISFDVDKTNKVAVELRGQFDGTALEGYVVGNIVFDPQTVNISGPENEIKKVAYAWVSIQRKDVDKTIKFDSPYVLMDIDGNEIKANNITLDTDTVSVTLPITATKEVPLTVDLVDGGGATVENAKITCDPATIKVSGDPAVLAGINKISLGTVDLASFALSFEENYPIVLDNKISNMTGITEAKVAISVIGLETRKFNVTNISVKDLPEGRSSEIITENVEVTLRGSKAVLDKIKANNIRVVADLADLGGAAGVFQPIAKIYVDGFTDVGAIATGGKDYSIYVKIT